jgi:hypothetical protein
VGVGVNTISLPVLKLGSPVLAVKSVGLRGSGNHLKNGNIVTIYGNTINYVLSSGLLGPQFRTRPTSHLQNNWRLVFFFSSSPLEIFRTARCRVSISAHSTMPRATRNAKRSHITVFKPRGKKQKTGSRTMMVVLVPKKTRRGKTIYYALSDEGGKSPKRKLPKTASHLEQLFLLD